MKKIKAVLLISLIGLLSIILDSYVGDSWFFVILATLSFFCLLLAIPDYLNYFLSNYSKKAAWVIALILMGISD